MATPMSFLVCYLIMPTVRSDLNAPATYVKSRIFPILGPVLESCMKQLIMQDVLLVG